MKALKTWVLVADGMSACVYAATGATGPHEARLAPVPAGHFNRHDTRRYFGAEPSTGFANARGDAHHAIGSHERRARLAQMEFLQEVTTWLGASDQAACFENLIVAASPRILGELRAAMPAALQRKVIHEIHADLTKAPIKEIESRVLGYLTAIQTVPR